MSKREIRNGKAVFFTALGLGVFFTAYAQQSAGIGLDTISKVIGIGGVLIGAFIGYISLRTANDINKVKADFQEALNKVKEELKALLHAENEKIEAKLNSSIKEVEAKMATRHDINGFKQIMMLQFENLRMELGGKIDRKRLDNE